MSDCENLCLSAGCKINAKKKQYPSCCHDITFNNLSNRDIAEHFPNAIYFSGLTLHPTKNGFYYTERNLFDDGRGPYTGFCVGPCPNLDTSIGKCKLPIHPRACINAKRGEKVCYDHRRKDGLPPVDPKFTEH